MHHEVVGSLEEESLEPHSLGKPSSKYMVVSTNRVELKIDPEHSNPYYGTPRMVWETLLIPITPYIAPTNPLKGRPLNGLSPSDGFRV